MRFSFLLGWAGSASGFLGFVDMEGMSGDDIFIMYLWSSDISKHEAFFLSFCSRADW